jgi:hypothetical protein
LRYRLILLFVIAQLRVFAQAGGNNTFEFLNLVNSARVSSLGGGAIALRDEDLNLATFNPSVLNPSMGKQAVLNYVNYFADINYGYVGYVHPIDSVGVFQAGLQYISYGTFITADETSAITGKFKAGEYAFNLGYSRPIDSLFTVGINLKGILSSLGEYSSNGAALDFGGSYYNTKLLFGATLLVKNLGLQFKRYEETREPLGFEIQAAVSQKLKKAPLRFHLGLNELQQFDLTYPNPDTLTTTLLATDEDEEDKKRNFTFPDKALRHISLGTEILLTKNFNLRVGYNYRRRQELKVSERPGMSGLSFGAGIKIFKLHLSYSWVNYHLGGISNHLSVAVRFADFNSKK